MSPRAALPAALLVLTALACGQPKPTNDAGTEDDSGVVEPPDAGTPDAGKPDAGPKDAGPMDAGFAAFPVTDWCNNLATARCFQRARCLDLSEAQLPDCLKREKAACDQEAYTRGVAGGRLQYLPQQAADCINAYGQGSCVTNPTECEPVFQGLVEPDGGCLTAEECQAGSFCLLYEQKCPFTCYGYRTSGQSCNFWDQQCDPTSSACSFVDGGYTCIARKNEGEACTFWSDCRADLGCINSVCMRQYAHLGESCREASGYPLCDSDLFCRQDQIPNVTPDAGVCMKRAGQGGVCAGYGSCMPGLRCSSNYATGTCIPLGSAGDTCTNYDDCKSELYCAPPTSRCTPLPKDGGDCGSQGSFYQCATGYYCDFNTTTCKPLGALGETCTYDGVCQSNSCEYGPIDDAGYGYRCVERCITQLDGGF